MDGKFKDVVDEAYANAEASWGHGSLGKDLGLAMHFDAKGNADAVYVDPDFNYGVYGLEAEKKSIAQWKQDGLELVQGMLSQMIGKPVSYVPNEGNATTLTINQKSGLFGLGRKKVQVATYRAVFPMEESPQHQLDFYGEFRPTKDQVYALVGALADK